MPVPQIEMRDETGGSGQCAPEMDQGEEMRRLEPPEPAPAVPHKLPSAAAATHTRIKLYMPVFSPEAEPARYCLPGWHFKLEGDGGERGRSPAYVCQ